MGYRRKGRYLSVILIVMVMLSAGCLDDGSSDGEFPTREDKIPDDAVKITPGADDHPPVLHSDEWEEPVPLSRVINTAGAEDAPYISPDGRHLYFFFTPDPKIPVHEQMAQGATGIYHSERTGSDWGEVKRVRLHDDPAGALDGCPTLEGDVLWFCSVREANHGEVDLYTARVDGHRAKGIENAGKRLNRELEVGEMDLTDGGTVMYYHGEPVEGKGYDIYRLEREGGSWAEPLPVEAVNSETMDGYPFTTQNGEELWFTRTHNGTPATFRSKWNGTGWGEPEMIISSFAGEPNLDSEGNIYFVHHFYGDGKMIEADIYMAKRIS